MADLSQLSNEQLKVYQDLLTKKKMQTEGPPLPKPPTPEGLKGGPVGRFGQAMTNLPGSLVHHVTHPFGEGMPAGMETFDPNDKRSGWEVALEDAKNVGHAITHPEEDPVGTALGVLTLGRGLAKRGTATSIASPEAVTEIGSGAARSAGAAMKEPIPAMWQGGRTMKSVGLGLLGDMLVKKLFPSAPWEARVGGAMMATQAPKVVKGAFEGAGRAIKDINARRPPNVEPPFQPKGLIESGKQPIITEPPPDTSGPIEPKLPENYLKVTNPKEDVFQQPPEKLIQEHEKLVNDLKTGKNLEQDLKEQSQELEQMKGETASDVIKPGTESPEPEPMLAPKQGPKKKESPVNFEPKPLPEVENPQVLGKVPGEEAYPGGPEGQTIEVHTVEEGIGNKRDLRHKAAKEFLDRNNISPQKIKTLLDHYNSPIPEDPTLTGRQALNIIQERINKTSSPEAKWGKLPLPKAKDFAQGHDKWAKFLRMQYNLRSDPMK